MPCPAADCCTAYPSPAADDVDAAQSPPSAKSTKSIRAAERPPASRSGKQNCVHPESTSSLRPLLFCDWLRMKADHLSRIQQAPRIILLLTLQLEIVAAKPPAILQIVHMRIGNKHPHL